MTVLCDALSNRLAFKWAMWNNLLSHLCTLTLDTSSICGKGSHIPPVLMCPVMSLHDDEEADSCSSTNTKRPWVTEDTRNRKTCKLVSPCLRVDEEMMKRSARWAGTKPRGGGFRRREIHIILFILFIWTTIRWYCIIKTGSTRYFRITLWFYAFLTSQVLVPIQIFQKLCPKEALNYDFTKS